MPHARGRPADLHGGSGGAAPVWPAPHPCRAPWCSGWARRLAVGATARQLQADGRPSRHGGTLTTLADTRRSHLGPSASRDVGRRA